MIQQTSYILRLGQVLSSFPVPHVCSAGVTQHVTELVHCVRKHISLQQKKAEIMCNFHTVCESTSDETNEKKLNQSLDGLCHIIYLSRQKPIWFPS